MKIITKLIYLVTLGLMWTSPLMAQTKIGEEVYKSNCMRCHQADGGGVPFQNAPLDVYSLVGGSLRALVSFVDKGTKDKPLGEYDGVMPSFKALSDQDLAGVLTYIRSNFGNEGGAVTPLEVSVFRGEAKGNIPTVKVEKKVKDIEEVIVFSGKLPPSKSDIAYAISTLSGEDLENIPNQRLDDKLRQVSGFSLFRRSSSRVAHPTTQGVTLRSIGPNGAGRTLLLLDGVPQNDPFGGWVYWSSIESNNLSQIDVIKGAGSGRWGSGALAGTLSLTSAPIEKAGLSASTNFGSFNTIDAEVRANFKGDKYSGYIATKYFDSEGYYLLGIDQRGTVDLKAASDNLALNIGSDAEVSDTVTLSFKAGYFKEHRVNGLALSTNDTKSYNFSLSLIGFEGEDRLSWQINTYYRDVDFRNSFASVTDDRATTRMVLDQFSVPGKGMGLNGLFRVPLSEGNKIEVGFDTRRMEGRTNENNRNLGAGFTRLRIAGGKENLIGGYAEYINDYNSSFTFTGGIRWDHWSTSDGQRLETDIVNGGVVREDSIEDRSGSLFNARAGVGYYYNENITLKASVYSGFRLPTINEFFRPFRVGNDITEANPNLKLEKLKGVDFGVVFERGEKFYLSMGYFYNKLENGIGNVTLAFGPGFFPPTGFVPAGGSLRQRQNIDVVETRGIEIYLKIQILENLNFEGSLVNGMATVKDFKTSPTLIGKRLAQSPNTIASTSLQYDIGEKWKLRATFRHTSRQFEDDQNMRILPAYSVMNIGAGYQLTSGIRAHFIIENLFNKHFLIGLNGSGLRSIGQPFTWTLGLKATF